jgi:hypothetical protein
MLGYDDVRQGFGVLGNLLHVNDSGDVKAAVTNIHANSGHQSAVRDYE